MVNKMKLKSLFFFLLLLCLSFNTAIANTKTSSIKQRQYIACGISQDHKSLAYKKNGQWHGFDADICRAIASAFLDNPERFKLIPVSRNNIGKALNSGQIDIMLGNSSLSSSEEVSLYVTPVDTLYYDRQIFAAREKRTAQSMRDFEGSKVCVMRDSTASIFLDEYNQKHALGFKILQMPSLISLKEAFYTNRCELISDSEIYLKHIISDVKTSNPAEILPEEIAYIPIKAYTAGNNPNLNIAMRWIINALKLADTANISSQNITTFLASKNPSVQNLLGIEPKTWQKLHLEPEWVQNYIPIFGNYQQILDRNIGALSKLNIDIKQNNMIEKGGFLISQPFI